MVGQKAGQHHPRSFQSQPQEWSNSRYKKLSANGDAQFRND
jgi:hypothetical protein